MGKRHRYETPEWAKRGHSSIQVPPCDREYYDEHEPLRKPYWYQRELDDRLNSLVLRVSYERVLKGEELEKLMYRWAVKHCSSHDVWKVINEVYYHGELFAADKRWNTKYSVTRMPYAFEKMCVWKGEWYTTDKVGDCFWCGATLFIPKHNLGNQHCGDRLCRELSAVMHKKHKQIRIAWRWKEVCSDRRTNAEATRAYFINRFFLKKLAIAKQEGKI